MCRHPQRTAIDGALVAGAPSTEVARCYGLVERSVRRHAASHLPERLMRASEAEEQLQAGRLLGRALAVVSDLEAMVAQGKAAGDQDAVLRAIRELRPSLELLGKITGQIQAGTTVNLMNQVWNRLGVRDEPELRRLVAVAQEAQAAGEDRATALAVGWLEKRGYRVLPPVDHVPNGGPSGV